MGNKPIEVSDEAKTRYWEAALKFLFNAQQEKRSVLEMPQSEEGLDLLGDYYEAIESMLAPMWPVAAKESAMNVVVTFAIVTCANLKEIEHDPGSKVTLRAQVEKQKDPKNFETEMWPEMKRVWTLWKGGYFVPAHFPVTYEQTLEPEQ